MRAGTRPATEACRAVPGPSALDAVKSEPVGREYLDLLPVRPRQPRGGDQARLVRLLCRVVGLDDGGDGAPMFMPRVCPIAITQHAAAAPRVDVSAAAVAALPAPG